MRFLFLMFVILIITVITTTLADEQHRRVRSRAKTRRSRSRTTSLATKTTNTRPTSRANTTSKAAATTTKAIAPTSAPVSNNGATYLGDGTWYDIGLGSCGWTNSDSEFVAALNAPQMQNGENPNKNSNCGRMIRVINTANNKAVNVKIVDTCPPCASGSVDLSPSAFSQIADLSTGRIKIKWSWS
ncbi:hypothetical protein CU098_008100 [Rhizopus stolonifer]|uniref:RlpA-like protein double-psi beta-barrel domain-containing protein n=1 Tax=Rhizopus stolonifer TaxID=4846 RepID=A0A367J2H3_RHIST|nr:hypothetical protein CU098_008100 [Rhizopus stolonifer]